MATLYVSEFNAGSSAGMQTVRQPPVASQVVAIGAGSLQSALFSGDTKLIRVHADTICSISIGTNPTAVATAMRMGSNQTEYFEVGPGQRIAVIQNV